MSAAPPRGFAVFSYEDFEAWPCTVLSPYGAFSKGLTQRIQSGALLWQEHDARPILQHAAWMVFRGLREADLQFLAKELQLNLVGYRSCTNVLLVIFYATTDAVP